MEAGKADDLVQPAPRRTVDCDVGVAWGAVRQRRYRAGSEGDDAKDASHRPDNSQDSCGFRGWQSSASHRHGELDGGAAARRCGAAPGPNAVLP